MCVLTDYKLCFTLRIPVILYDQNKKGGPIIGDRP